MQEKKNYFFSFLNSHLYENYRKGGLRAFCEAHGINYNSARKVTSGQTDRPLILLKIKEAVKADYEREDIFPEKFIFTMCKRK